MQERWQRSMPSRTTTESISTDEPVTDSFARDARAFAEAILGRSLESNFSATRSSAARRDDGLLFAESLLGKTPRSASEPSLALATEPALAGWLRDVSTLHEGNWDPAKHPRGGHAQNRGWFSTTGGPRGGKVPDAVQQQIDNASRWYLPSKDKGTWTKTPGDSTLRLKKAIKVGRKWVREVAYIKGVPVLDTFALEGKTATIILTGHNDTDIQNAKAAWQKLNKRALPPDAVFHHDLLHVVEETVEIGGKKTKVLVGKMQLIPKAANSLVFHQGSASVARKYYAGLGIGVSGIAELARKEAALAGKASSFVAKVVKKIQPGKIAKGVLPFVGRNVARAIPVVSSGLALLEFSENVEAHGFDGAVVRTIPVLGDLIAAHDLGSDLAKQIVDDANAAMDANIKAINDQVADAWQKASEQTIDAYNELASRIKVTNTYGPNGLVDPGEIADALRDYRTDMQRANLLSDQMGDDFDFDASATAAKQRLEERLERASQKNTPVSRRREA